MENEINMEEEINHCKACRELNTARIANEIYKEYLVSRNKDAIFNPDWDSRTNEEKLIEWSINRISKIVVENRVDNLVESYQDAIDSANKKMEDLLYIKELPQYKLNSQINRLVSVIKYKNDFIKELRYKCASIRKEVKEQKVKVRKIKQVTALKKKQLMKYL